MTHSFEEYKNMKAEVADDIMTRLHPILKEWQEKSLEQSKALTQTNLKQSESLEKLDKKVDSILGHPMFKAWNMTTNGIQLFKLIGGLLLGVAALWAAVKFLGVSFIEEIKKHI